MGFSTAEAHSAARAAFGRALGRAALTLAFQNVFYMMALAALTAIVPAFFLRRFPAPERSRPGPAA